MLETRKQLIADIAEGYDLVILGADKWAQLHDQSFYKTKTPYGAMFAAFTEISGRSEKWYCSPSGDSFNGP